MSKQSVEAQFKALLQRRIKLSNFKIEINQSLMHSEISDLLTVQDANGEYPVVAALGEEPLGLLHERVQAVGGIANIFVKTKQGVTMLIATVGSRNNGALDLSNDDEWMSSDASIDMLLALLQQHKNGVLMPNHLPAVQDITLNVQAESVPVQYEHTLAVR